ncbi:MAG: DNA polymerase III subunit beta [Gammaproteobacteria bacterium]|nr:MAG: DNA polymerase III subunit beta [Gammaproteobacteria bacterium]
MQLSINRELLLKAISLIAKAADKRHNMVILGNIKINLTQTHLYMTASDLEVELMSKLALPEGACLEEGSITLPSDKLRDICKLLPSNAQINLTSSDNSRCLITSDKSKFTLGTLPSADYPILGEPENITPLTINRTQLSDMLSKTQFAMAIQDVRYYLTGMLFEVSQRLLTTVATDGHRLALSKSAIEVDDDLNMQAILPRKAVVELDRLLNELGKLLNDNDNPVTLKFGREFLQVELPFGNVDSSGIIDNSLQVTFTARLIDGKFPDYRRVMPANSDKQALINKEQMTEVLRRVSILSNEKSRGVILNFDAEGMIELRANNAEQDEAVEKLQSQYSGDPIELSFNAQYLQDVLDVLEGNVVLQMSQANASTLLNQHGDELHQYVVMPMRI